MYSFGKGSLEKLSDCHKDLIKIMSLAISRSRIDFSITCGARSVSNQLALYREGKTTLDPRDPSDLAKARHVITDKQPQSMAVDICIWHKDKVTRKKLAYDAASLAYVAGIVTCCAQELLAKGEVDHFVRWGGNWDRDGVILKDQSFDDLPHFELVRV